MSKGGTWTELLGRSHLICLCVDFLYDTIKYCFRQIFFLFVSISMFLYVVITHAYNWAQFQDEYERFWKGFSKDIIYIFLNLHTVSGPKKNNKSWETWYPMPFPKRHHSHVDGHINWFVSVYKWTTRVGLC